MRWHLERSAFACCIAATVLGCGSSPSSTAAISGGTTGSTAGGAFAGASQSGASSTGGQDLPDASSSANASGVGAGGADAATGGPTFYKDVDPILQNSCQRCHITGGIAPFPLVTYDDAKSNATEMVIETGQGSMPPWGAVSTSTCAPRFGWQNNPQLTPAAIATLSAWYKAGSPEGNPADAPPPVAPAPSTLQNPSLLLKPPAPFSITSGTSDQFRCFVLDPKLTATRYVDGTFFVPGNPTIVHHALVFTDPAGASKALVTDPATQSYDCFGGPNVTNTALLAAWAPGGVPVDYPPNSGAPLDPGTLLVMQVHYHPHSATAVLGPDQTTFQMRFAASVPTHVAATYLIGNFDTAVADGTGLLPGPDDPPSGVAFVIPPNVSAHTETMQFTVPALLPTMHIAAIAGHEHYVGTSVDITIHRANPQPDQPADECLLSIPQWDFNWQRIYAYDATMDQVPVASAGDVVQIKCTYNNTVNNPFVVQSLLDQGLSSPTTVKLGETTLDEMCLGAFLVTY
jgi:hypothetical protein